MEMVCVAFECYSVRLKGPCNTSDKRFRSSLRVWKPAQSGTVWFDHRHKSAVYSCVAFMAIFFPKWLSNKFIAPTKKKATGSSYIALKTWFERSKNTEEHQD